MNRQIPGVKFKMEYRQIKTRKIYEEVAENILDWIKSGQLKPGDKLDSVQILAEKFQVGRAAIREALSAIRAMGLIEMKQGEGTYVREFDPTMVTVPVSVAAITDSEDILNLLEVRKILEAGSALVASQKRTESDLKKIKAALDRMKTALDNQELGEQADIEFHLAVTNSTQNPILINLMNRVSDMMVEAMRESRRLLIFSKIENNERLYEQHAKIYEAIKDMNPESARQLMVNHLQFVENLLSKILIEH